MCILVSCCLHRVPLCVGVVLCACWCHASCSPYRLLFASYRSLIDEFSTAVDVDTDQDMFSSYGHTHFDNASGPNAAVALHPELEKLEALRIKATELSTCSFYFALLSHVHAGYACRIIPYYVLFICQAEEKKVAAAEKAAERAAAKASQSSSGSTHGKPGLAVKVLGHFLVIPYNHATFVAARYVCNPHYMSTVV